MPRGWAMPPMKPWPMTRTLICFMVGLLPALLALLLGGLLGLRFRLLGGLLLRLRSLLLGGLRGRLLGRGLGRGAGAVDQHVEFIGALLAGFRLGPGAVLEAEVNRPPVVRAARVGGQLRDDRREIDLGRAEDLVGARAVLVELAVAVDDLDRVHLAAQLPGQVQHAGVRGFRSAAG